MSALRAVVTIGVYEPELDPPNDRPARVTWALSDGRSVTSECLSARGGPDRPFAPSEIREKIHGIVSAPYPAMPAEVDRLLALDPKALSTCWSETVAAMTKGARP